MNIQQIRKVGNSYVVTVPKELVERNDWHEGTQVAVELTEMETRPVLRPEIKAIIDDIWEENVEAMNYLAGR